MIRLARIAALWLIAAVVCLGIDPKTLTPQGYVSDFAGVLSAQTRVELSSYAKRVEQATGAEMAFVTISTLDGEPIESFANDLYRQWGIGKKGKDEGLLFLLVIQDRRSRLEVGFGLEPAIPDGYSGGLLRELRPFLRASDYGQAMLAAAGKLGEKIAAFKGVSIPAGSPNPRPPNSGSDGLPVMQLIFMAVFLLWIFNMGRRGGGGGGFLPGLILGNMMNRSVYYGGRRSGGGGFGGYDSGDSFGGFGGGDSGGGGASSDW